MNPSPWSLRALLSPVATRLLIYGTNPMDLEAILARVEGKPVLNAKMLETRWLAEWERQGAQWRERAEAAREGGHVSTRSTCLFHAATCGLARYLVNTSDIGVRRAVYADCARGYRAYLESAFRFEELRVPCPGGETLPALLHLPAGEGPHPCVAVLAGLGSCKEEMHTIARALVERGIAALVPDMPGSGAALFDEGVPCTRAALESATRGLADAMASHPLLDGSRLGVSGLCMGGGYAFRAAALEGRFRFAATLFPLFIPMVDNSRIPSWMRSGAWVDFQTGGVGTDAFIASMGPGEDDTPRVPFLVVHGRHDNWMTWEAARSLLERVAHPRRDLVTIEDEPALTGGSPTTHAMPVGERMHWAVPMMADWASDRIAELSSR